MGGIVRIFGSLAQGESTARSYEYNADIASRNAIIAGQQGDAAAEAQQRDSRRAIGAMVASYGASGVQTDSGSPLEVLGDSARMAELDRLTILNNYKLKGQGFSQQASLAKMGAKSARTASYFEAASSALDMATDSTNRGSPIPFFGG